MMIRTVIDEAAFDALRGTWMKDAAGARFAVLIDRVPWRSAQEEYRPPGPEPGVHAPGTAPDAVPPDIGPRTRPPRYKLFLVEGMNAGEFPGSEAIARLEERSGRV